MPSSFFKFLQLFLSFFETIRRFMHFRGLFVFILLVVLLLLSLELFLVFLLEKMVREHGQSINNQNRGGGHIGRAPLKEVVKNKKKTTTAKFDRATTTKFERRSNKHAVSLRYQYSTPYREMYNFLMYRGLLAKHHKYEFSIP